MCVGTGWQRPIGCLIFVGHSPPKSPMISGSFAKNDLQLEAPYECLPDCSDPLNTITVRLLRTCCNTRCTVRPPSPQLTATHATATHTSSRDKHTKCNGQVSFGREPLREPVFIIGPSTLQLAATHATATPCNTLQHTLAAAMSAVRCESFLLLAPWK